MLAKLMSDATFSSGSADGDSRHAVACAIGQVELKKSTTQLIE